MSFFSRSSTKSASSSVAGKDVPPPTSKIFTTPLDGVKPTKKWNYDEGQLKQVCTLLSLSSDRKINH